MSDSLYRQLLYSALAGVDSESIIDCAIGPTCMGIHTALCTGLAFTTGDAWAAASALSVAEVEKAYRGRKLSEVIADYDGQEPLAVNMALAALNSVFIRNGKPDDLNWFDWLRGKKRLAMVGYFHPMMERVLKAGVEPVIFELEDIPGTHRPEEAAELMPACDVVLITGATFASKSTHVYIPHIHPDADAFIFGHSTPMSSLLLRRFTIGSSRVHDKEGAFAIIRQGGGIRDMKGLTSKVVLSGER